ncbi:hypothetical protein ABTE17_22320, partial [Acinetobacter baumannii]
EDVSFEVFEIWRCHCAPTLPKTKLLAAALLAGKPAYEASDDSRPRGRFDRLGRKWRLWRTIVMPLLAVAIDATAKFDP